MKTKKAWVAWSNTDTTEGRGWHYPLAVCSTYSTAVRLGHKGSVQGCDCDMTEETIYEIEGKWVGPCLVVQSTNEDNANEKIRRAKLDATERAKKAGLTDDEIKALSR